MVAFLALILGSPLATAQDCNTILACNDGVQVSVDQNCIAVITPDVVLEAMQYDPSFYSVEVRDLNGIPLGTNTLNGSHVGMTFEVKVTLDGCDLSCWGEITLEDKLPPIFQPCDTVTVECEAPTHVGAPGIPSPVAVDACGGVITYSSADNSMSMSCATDFSRMIMRRWVAADQFGNTDTCIQVIQVRQADLDDVVFPPSYDDDEEPSFSCDNNLRFNPDGTPDPLSTGFPTGVNCSNIQFYYTDLVFDLCGVSQKTVRQWVVIDWCTGRERSNFQTIKIVDDVAPICAGAGVGDTRFVNIPTDEGTCTGTYDVPPPNVTTECSEWTYIVGYKLRDLSGTPFENPIYDNVVTNADGSFTITELPNDTTWIVYTVTDACGNETQCFTEVVVDDTESPSPVCEGFTTVALDDIGWADVFALSLDDNSHDNCGIDRFEVRRESTSCGFPDDTSFGEKVNFCCTDIANSPIRVILRVYDDSGNFNDCVVNVTVQDKKAPTIITCVPNVELQCGQDPTDLSLTGEMDLLIAEDNCDLEVTSRISGSLGSCGLGTISRIWTVTDPQGRTDQCTQTIRVVDNDPFDGDEDIDWPNNVDEVGCTDVGLTPEVLGSIPELTNTDCTDLAMSYDDEVFYNAPGVCVKIIRHWRVVDWCSANSQNPDFFEYDQKIEVNNSVAPTFMSGCSNQTVSPATGECSASVSAEVEATDDCTAASDIEYSYRVDINSDNSIDITGVGRAFDRVFPAGQHRVTFTAEDECGNSDNCSFIVRVTDNKAPQPICLGEVTWVMAEDGTAEIWASDFNLKSTDECTADSLLRYSFNEQGTLPELTFTCDDLDDGVGAEIDLEMYVIDPDGNAAFCAVTLNLQDNQDYCPDTGNRAALGGYVTDASGNGLQNIEVELTNKTMIEENMSLTQEEGEYMFDDINYYDGYEVSPYKNDDTDNGVSTLDLVLIQRHILNMQELEGPYRLIAADVNSSKSISGADVVELRKIILGIASTFDSNTSWRFVDANHDWDAVNFAYDFPESIEMQELYHREMDANFNGIKIGDVNGSASLDLDGRSGSSVGLVVDDRSFEAGEVVRISLKAQNDLDLLGMQLALDLKGLTYLGVEGIRPDQAYAQGSVVKLTMDAVQGMQLAANEQVVTLLARANRAGTIAESIAIAPATTFASEAYPTVDDLATIELRARGAAEIADQVMLQQNTPNPWSERSVITYSIPVDGDVVLTMYDVAGRQIYKSTQYLTAGTHSQRISKQELGATGVIYYRLEAAGASITKKMILMD